MYRNVGVVAAGVGVDVHVIGEHRESVRLPMVDPHIWVPSPSFPCFSRGGYDNYEGEHDRCFGMEQVMMHMSISH